MPKATVHKINRVTELANRIYPVAGFIVVRQPAWKDRITRDRTIAVDSVVEVSEAIEGGCWVKTTGDRFIRVVESMHEIMTMIECCKRGIE